VLYVEIERFWKNGRKRGGLSSSCGAFSRAKNTGMALLVTWGTGLRPDRDSYAMLSSFGRCYMGKNESAVSSFTFVYRPAKLAVCAVFRCFALQLQKAISFQPLRPIWVNFMSNQRVFRALHGNRAILEEWTKKRGGLSSSCGAFSGLKIQEWHCSKHGVRGFQPDRDSYAMLSSFGRCYMGKSESPFQVYLRLSPPQSWLLVPFFAVLPSNFKRPYLSTARPIWVNFMSNQRVFRALRGNRAILEEWTKKEGAFLPHVGLFQG